MIKKIILAIIGLVLLAGTSFGAYYSMYDYEPCYPVNECYTYEACVQPKAEQVYTSCEFSGSCGCLQCEVSRVGTGLWNVRTSYNENVRYMRNPSSMYADNYYYDS